MIVINTPNGPRMLSPTPGRISNETLLRGTMPRTTISAAKAKSYIEQEGLEYFITSYCPLEHIEDPELRRLCQEAEAALNAVKKYLDPIIADWS